MREKRSPSQTEDKGGRAEYDRYRRNRTYERSTWRREKKGCFDHVRRGSNTENVFHERQRLAFRVLLPLQRAGYTPSRPFHATFTILFYFERYISLDFIARPVPSIPCTTGAPEISIASFISGISFIFTSEVFSLEPCRYTTILGRMHIYVSPE